MKTRSEQMALLAALLSCLFASAAQAFDPGYDRDADPSAIRFVSADSSVCIRSDFPGGRISQCVEISPSEFDMVIRPEKMPINDSAWYAFQVRTTKACDLQIRLRYEGGTHRYTPLVSYDGRKWFRKASLVTAVHPMGGEAVLSVRAGPRPMWISAHQILSNGEVGRWVDDVAKRDFVTRDVIGYSVKNRPIERLKITQSNSPATVFLMARQHPTEVSGMLGMMQFVEAIVADTLRAKAFREKFTTVVIPTANPDGVARGHWRCNAAGVDLNRDWKHFRQPETRAIRDELLSYRSKGKQSIYLFLDFHATYEDAFYTAHDVDEAFPPNFTSNWLQTLDERFDWYDVNHNLDHNENRTTSKAWVRDTLDVAAVTYEFGDETNASQISELARGGADEMMRLLLIERENQPRVSQKLVSTREPR